LVARKDLVLEVAPIAEAEDPHGQHVLLAMLSWSVAGALLHGLGDVELRRKARILRVSNQSPVDPAVECRGHALKHDPNPPPRSPIVRH
jgi:hypothetical protein